MNVIKTISTQQKTHAITAIAIDKDKNSQQAVKWAVDHLVCSENSCILVHVLNHGVNPKSAEDADGDEMQKLFLPYRGFCARKGIQAKEIVLHDLDVTNALVHFIDSHSIDNIVVGVCHHSLLLRRFRHMDVPTSLLKIAPDTCSIYVISSKGKVHNFRSATNHHRSSDSTSSGPHSQVESLQDDSASEISRSGLSCDSWRSDGTSKNCSSTENSQTTTYATTKSTIPNASPLPPMDNYVQNSFHSKSSSDTSSYSVVLSYRSGDTTENIDSSSASTSSKDHSTYQNPDALDAEIKRLRLELKQTMEMYNLVNKEAVAINRKAKELQWQKEEARKLNEARFAEEAALALIEMERHKATVASTAAQKAQRLVDLQHRRAKIIEMKAMHEAKEKLRVMEALAHHLKYRKYSIKEIEIATDYFSSSLKIGEGGYGPVYKAILDHTPVAIKILRPDISQGVKQFKQEIEVLGNVRHPNMVILLGACPEYGCLVYEHMRNGSLEDRLFRKDNSPSIPWRIRFKITAEIATALLFLHQNKPEPIVHRDLKPANILLDHNYVGKIGDVGLARLVPPSVANSVTQYHMTATAGTFCYIDPEYQQTGLLGVKSDLFSFGVMLLQIITARPPMGLGHQIEMAIENGRFQELLDPTVTDWPVEETLSLAKLALQCCELRKRDRPDLATVVLPELIRLRDFGLESVDSSRHEIVIRPDPHNSLPEVRTLNEEGMRNNPNVEMEIRRRSMYQEDRRA